MKKILFASMTVLALAVPAEARNLYSNEDDEARHRAIENVLGPRNGSWGVMRGIRYHVHHSVIHHNSHAAGAGKNAGASASIVAYGRMLQHSGFRVSEHPAFGGVHHVHHGWAHYVGRAIDVNIGRGVREASSSFVRTFDALASRARAAGYTVLWKVAGHFDHIHIQR